jgi:tetratricopeptide (TPR) repeat protein
LTLACAVVTAVSSVVIWGMYRSIRAEHSRSISAQAQLAPALMRLGDNALAAGQVDEASGDYRAALAIIDDLLAADIHNLEFLLHRLDCHIRIGNLYRKRGDLKEAQAQYALALDLARQLTEADPSNAAYQERFAQVQQLAADVNSRSTGAKPNDLPGGRRNRP